MTDRGALEIPGRRLREGRNAEASASRRPVLVEALARLQRAAGLADPRRRAFAGLGVLILALTIGYVASLRTLRVQVDGRVLILRTHVPTVGEALAEARIHLEPEDQVWPAIETPVAAAPHVSVRRARTVFLTVDGRARLHRTHALTVGEALTEAGVKWIPEDRITINGQEVSGDQPLYLETEASRRISSRGGPRPQSLSTAPPTVAVSVERAVPIAVQDGETPFTFLTTAQTLGEALLEEGITLYAADRIEPALDTPITTGLQATIERSRPVTLLADGQVRETRSRAATVGDLLQEEGLSLGPLDYSQPGPDQPLSAGQRVVVVRVREVELEEQESIPYETEYRPNSNLEIDNLQVDNAGAPGQLKRALRVRYENEVEVSRNVVREWVEKPPQSRIISYGTKIVLRTITTADGTFTYWRKLRVLATAYTAATCGKSRDHPQYGITRTGMKARKGIIAVDPPVIPFYTQIYVPGYGTGVAADTGSAIKGMHVDLCYDEWNFVDWWKWTDIYLLGSPPPANQIKWILPSYPTER
ncbi:MAG: ubiquitin-like domain-containing protein [Anaerolineae bacterium]